MSFALYWLEVKLIFIEKKVAFVFVICVSPFLLFSGRDMVRVHRDSAQERAQPPGLHRRRSHPPRAAAAASS